MLFLSYLILSIKGYIMKDVSILIDDYKFNFRVCCLIENKNRYLLLKNNTVDFLNLPGGRVHAGENTLDAIKRELKEELNLVDVQPKLLKMSEQFFHFDNNNYHELVFVYYVKLKNDHPFCKMDNIPNLDNKNETMIWVNKNSLKNHKILPEFIYTLKKSKNITHLIFDKLKK